MSKTAEEFLSRLYQSDTCCQSLSGPNNELVQKALKGNYHGELPPSIELHTLSISANNRNVLARVEAMLGFLIQNMPEPAKAK